MTSYEKFLAQSLRSLDSSIADLDEAWETCPIEVEEDIDHICRELRRLYNWLDSLRSE